LANELAYEMCLSLDVGRWPSRFFNNSDLWCYVAATQLFDNTSTLPSPNRRSSTLRVAADHMYGSLPVEPGPRRRSTWHASPATSNAMSGRSLSLPQPVTSVLAPAHLNSISLLLGNSVIDTNVSRWKWRNSWFVWRWVADCDQRLWEITLHQTKGHRRPRMTSYLWWTWGYSIRTIRLLLQKLFRWSALTMCINSNLATHCTCWMHSRRQSWARWRHSRNKSKKGLQSPWNTHARIWTERCTGPTFAAPWNHPKYGYRCAIAVSGSLPLG